MCSLYHVYFISLLITTTVSQDQNRLLIHDIIKEKE
jgi:hypothetical protein